MRILSLAVVTASLVLALGAVSAAAQQQPSQQPSQPRALATRAELDSLLKSGKVSGDEAAVIRERLKNGDFALGDRVVIHVLEEPTLNDTFAVKQGGVLVLPNLPDISMNGVLRSEAQAYLAAQITKYVRTATVIVDPLVRVSILGAVNKPGFYTIRADMLASEAVMAGGGPTAEANLKKTEVRRNGQVVRDDKQLQLAFNRGVSLDALNLQAGDEIYVGTRSNARNTIGYVGVISGAILAVVAIARLL
jgi:polysaccharide biosynthesis/export protein/SLBB domain-containing protein